jgi:hypothetical protein
MTVSGCLHDAHFQNLECKTVSVTKNLLSSGTDLMLSTTNIIFGSLFSTTATTFLSIPAIKQPENTELLNVGFYCVKTVGDMSSNSNIGVAVGTVASVSGTVGNDICAFVPNSMENTNDVASGLTLGNCSVVFGDKGMTGVNNIYDLTFTTTAGIEFTNTIRDIYITIISSINTGASNLNDTDVGGTFTAVSDAIMPFIVVRSFNPPPGVTTSIQKDLFRNALS